MKKLIIIFLLSFIASYSFAQSDTLYPQPPQNLGGLNVAVRDTGGLLVRQTMVAPVYNDTTAANAANPYTKSYTASIIYTRDVKAYWFRQDNPRKWVIMGSSNGNNNIDTIFTKIPIFVDTTSQPGRRILTLLHLNGLESGGVVTLDSCMTIDVTPAIYYLNYRQYTTALVIGLALEPADVFDRTDAVVVDSNLTVRIKKGLAGNIAPYVNPSSEVLLANIPVPANAPCLSISQEIVFDGVGDNASQWINSTSGTITALTTNTTFPFHLLQDLYVQTYTDASQIIFTKPSGTDTVKSTSILKIPISVNGAFTNQIQAQWFNGSTAVSNNIVLNPYFNPNDSNFYQLLVAPFNIWNFSSIVYNKLVLTFAGQDIAGGKGLYMDYIQIQTGVMNNNPFLVLTTNGTSGVSTYDNLSHVLNIPNYSGSGGGGDGLANFYLKDSSLSSDRTVDLNDKILQFTNSSDVMLSMNPATGVSYFQTLDGTGSSGFILTSNVSDGYTFLINSSDGANAIAISGNAADNTITHTAGSHIFNGKIINANDSINTQYNIATWDGDTLKRAALPQATANNGLSASGNNIQLGGNPLVVNTSIAKANRSFTMSGKGNVTLSEDDIDGANITSSIAVESSTGGNPPLVWLRALDFDGGNFTQMNLGNNGVNLSVSDISNNSSGFTFQDTQNSISMQDGVTGSTIGFSQTLATLNSAINVQNANGTQTGFTIYDSLYDFQLATLNTNTVDQMLVLTRTLASGTVGNGIGQSIDFRINSNGGSGAVPQSNQLISKWTTAANASRTSEFSITGVNNAVTNTLFTLSGNGEAIFTAPIRLKGYVVSALPTGVTGDKAYVTDALGPTYHVTVVGGGAVVTPVFFNGSTWIVD